MTSAPAHHRLERLARLAERLKAQARRLGFQAAGIATTDLGQAEQHLLDWLAAGHQGEMGYMARHGLRRSRPALLEPGTVRVISARMDYLPPAAADADQVLRSPDKAYVSRYALGRDYHKVVRRRLASLARFLIDDARQSGVTARAFCDSAPVLEKALAERAGLGWIGKHSNLLSREAGSWFFLGEIYTNLALPADPSTDSHCGDCRRCLDACPTGAIIAPYRVDARRCISYLTIELAGSIPEPLRPAIGNRIYGCDDCQLVCPWNRFSTPTSESDFRPRHRLDNASLVELFGWSEDQFRKRTEGSAIRRIGYHRWLRNLAVALGNGPARDQAIDALRARAAHPIALVAEHVHWALARLQTEPVSAVADSTDASVHLDREPSSAARE